MCEFLFGSDTYKIWQLWILQALGLFRQSEYQRSMKTVGGNNKYIIKECEWWKIMDLEIVWHTQLVRVTNEKS